VIRGETLRCREIVKGILDFARETKLETERANLNRIIADVLVILEKHVAFQNVHVMRNLDPTLPEITVDVNQIKSVINNLAVNAADAMPGGGTITFTTSASPDGKFALMRV
jgi:two-component system NtrC family sensor kinase